MYFGIYFPTQMCYNGYNSIAMRLNSMDFKDQIKHARETVHMSQQEFAAAIGVAHSSLNRWELGIRKPTYALQRKFYSFCEQNNITFEDKKI